MEVILLKDVDKVGLRGEVVNVARGYMRNFLGPRGLAETATPAKLAELTKREEQRARHEARSVEQAQEIAERLRHATLRFERNAGPRGRLFGSVTATDITDELWRSHKIRVDRRKIDLGEPLKRIGAYEIPMEIFQDVSVEVRTLVAPEGRELPSEDEMQAWLAEERAETAAAAGEPPADETAEDGEADLPAAEAAEVGEAELPGADTAEAETPVTTGSPEASELVAEEELEAAAD